MSESMAWRRPSRMRAICSWRGQQAGDLTTATPPDLLEGHSLGCVPQSIAPVALKSILSANGEDGQHAGLTEVFDVAVLDLGLPKVDGVTVLKSWREAACNFPVLILTARDGWPEKVAAFKAGADDFLTKMHAVCSDDQQTPAFAPLDPIHISHGQPNTHS